MILLDGKALSEKIMNNLKVKIAELDKAPTLAVVLVGTDSASQIYVNKKNECAKNLGIKSVCLNFSESITENELLAEIDKLANDDEIDAILVQLPLPKHINKNNVINKIPPNKDVDGFHPYNIGCLLSGVEPFALPCTPKGILRLLKEYNITIEGKNVVVIGRSNIVGKPAALLILKENATVTICHSKTKNLKDITRQADILIVATGKPKFIDKSFVKEDAVIVDVGINRNSDGKLSGDVDFESVKDKASYITPVPGGVGPMTISMLMENTLELCLKK